MPADTPNLHQNTPASQAEIMDGPEPEPGANLFTDPDQHDPDQHDPDRFFRERSRNRSYTKIQKEEE